MHYFQIESTEEGQLNWSEIFTSGGEFIKSMQRVINLASDQSVVSDMSLQEIFNVIADGIAGMSNISSDPIR